MRFFNLVKMQWTKSHNCADAQKYVLQILGFSAFRKKVWLQLVSRSLLPNAYLQKTLFLTAILYT